MNGGSSVKRTHKASTKEGEQPADDQEGEQPADGGSPAMRCERILLPNDDDGTTSVRDNLINPSPG